MLDADPGGKERTKQVPSRLQSPSSILTYKQCPRKYFYRYIARLPSKKSIHLVRGSIVHKVLEEFYRADLSRIPDESFPCTVKVLLQDMFSREWKAAEPELGQLGLTAGELEGFYEETKVMIHNFYHYLMDKLSDRGGTYVSAMEEFRPRTEIELRSPAHHVRGFADAIHEHDGRTYILDYKTSRKAEITPEYELQLSIYGMIFAELHRVPDEVGIFFLKHGQELRIPVTRAMIERAQIEVEDIHERTCSRNLEDYPLRPGPLCKWSTGQCDYYELCFGNRRLDEFVQLGSRRTDDKNRSQ